MGYGVDVRLMIVVGTIYSYLQTLSAQGAGHQHVRLYRHGKRFNFETSNMEI
jgi:hypothetical protein